MLRPEVVRRGDVVHVAATVFDSEGDAVRLTLLRPARDAAVFPHSRAVEVFDVHIHDIVAAKPSLSPGDLVEVGGSAGYRVEMILGDWVVYSDPHVPGRRRVPLVASADLVRRWSPPQSPPQDAEPDDFPLKKSDPVSSDRRPA